MINKQKTSILSVRIGLMVALSIVGLGMIMINPIYAPINHGESSPKSLAPSGHHEGSGCHNPCLDHQKPGQICPMYCVPDTE